MNLPSLTFLPTLPSGAIFDVLTLAVSFLVSLAVYPLLIKGLRRLKIGQVIREELPEHRGKAGTPTGGGILFVVFGAIAGLLSLRMHQGALPATVALVLFGLLGLFDDLAKLRFGHVGIPARLKFPLQVLFAVPVVWLTHGPQHLVPVFPDWLDLPLALVAALAILGTVNGVNFNDGLDGLASGQCVIALLAVVLLLPGAQPGEKAVAMTLVGGLLAFLVFNRHPARVFMGDAGALGVGAALAAMAIQQGWAALLLLVGVVFVVEVLSVILQVGFFKATGGRRLFKKTPIHHSFQLSGWSEPRIVYTFWVVGLIAAVASGFIARMGLA